MEAVSQNCSGILRAKILLYLVSYMLHLKRNNRFRPYQLEAANPMENL